ncbi:MAG TPA: hypothetical protein VJN21_03610 [Candidatus Acidoferrales bacterium]|nr:hypothetical protein [Candidatus Acidoferrales bacterium]
MNPKLSLKVVATLFLALSAFPAYAQVAGPIAPPPKFEAKQIPAKPEPGAPPLPAEEMIHRFTANEDLIKKAFDSQSYDQSVRVEELVDNGGNFNFSGQVYTKSDGQRYVRVVKPPESSLKYTEFSLEDVKTVDGFPLFILSKDKLPLYNLSYEGKEKLDEIDTFIFRVKPKQLGKDPLFDGVVWVDTQDFAIVKTYGQFMTLAGNYPASFPFTMFDTYRENLQGHFWFPTYLRSDGSVQTQQGEVPIRLVVRATDFKPASAEAPAPAAPSKPPGTPNHR